MDSLFYRVFKAKYLMQNCLRVIYAWKSILKARKVITLGSKWRVRDGSLVRIYEDNWIPGNHEGRIISPKLNLPPQCYCFPPNGYELGLVEFYVD